MYVHLGADGVCDRRTEIKTNEAVTKKNDKRSFSAFLKRDPSAKTRGQRLRSQLALSHYLSGWKEKVKLDGEDEQRSDARVRKAKQKMKGWEGR